MANWSFTLLKMELSSFRQLINQMMILTLKLILWIFLACLGARANREIQQQHFPKIIWTYWHQGYQSASTFTKMCINNQRHYAQKSGWSYRLLTKENLQDYLNVSQVQRIWKMNGVDLIQPKADIIRMMLLLHYGGMWIDTNSFFIQDLSWLDTLKEQPHIYNKMGERPEVLLGSFSEDNPYIEFDSLAQKNKVYPLPNLEVWFMVAVPNSTFYRDVLKTIENVASMGRLQANRYYASLGVNQRFNYTDYFLMIIQLKQIQLKNSNQRTYAINYYKIWNLQAAKTAFLLLNFYKFRVKTAVEALFGNSLNFYQQKLRGPRYFVKLVGEFYQKANEILDNYEHILCLGTQLQIKRGSLIEAQLFKYSQQDQKIKKIRQIMDKNSYQLKCQSKADKYRYLINVILLISSTFLFYLIFLLYKIIVWRENPKNI